ncbi:hypothetical protein CBR_g9019 [Chara braunii]|uniref:GTD-binding domain-containing protein n=1 Tax=Chara braunii TaxID=69332 RepID=A0A388KNT5_CHABU|nr:hypothetical protein CBR_g9019 [Chara braunii]|eukprot:GBG71603.1 hypothetical protein CBR_g9019 [Chara braunii]
MTSVAQSMERVAQRVNSWDILGSSARISAERDKLVSSASDFVSEQAGHCDPQAATFVPSVFTAIYELLVSVTFFLRTLVMSASLLILKHVVGVSSPWEAGKEVGIERHDERSLSMGAQTSQRTEARAGIDQEDRWGLNVFDEMKSSSGSHPRSWGTRNPKMFASSRLQGSDSTHMPRGSIARRPGPSFGPAGLRSAASAMDAAKGEMGRLKRGWGTLGTTSNEHVHTPQPRQSRGCLVYKRRGATASQVVPPGSVVTAIPGPDCVPRTSSGVDGEPDGIASDSINEDKPTDQAMDGQFDGDVESDATANEGEEGRRRRGKEEEEDKELDFVPEALEEDDTESESVPGRMEDLATGSGGVPFKGQNVEGGAEWDLLADDDLFVAKDGEDFDYFMPISAVPPRPSRTLANGTSIFSCPHDCGATPLIGKPPLKEMEKQKQQQQQQVSEEGMGPLATVMPGEGTGVRELLPKNKIMSMKNSGKPHTLSSLDIGGAKGDGDNNLVPASGQLQRLEEAIDYGADDSGSLELRLASSRVIKEEDDWKAAGSREVRFGSLVVSPGMEVVVDEGAEIAAPFVEEEEEDPCYGAIMASAVDVGEQGDAVVPKGSSPSEKSVQVQLNVNGSVSAMSDVGKGNANIDMTVVLGLRKELEIERMAAARAAEQAMMMIMKLQTEKAALLTEMERLARDAEARQEYDESSLAQLKTVPNPDYIEYSLQKHPDPEEEVLEGKEEKEVSGSDSELSIVGKGNSNLNPTVVLDLRKELEIERTAAARAAEEAMMMIMSLQKEKTALLTEMERIVRDAEERQEHDESTLAQLKRDVTKKLKTNLILERKIDACGKRGGGRKVAGSLQRNHISSAGESQISLSDDEARACSTGHAEWSEDDTFSRENMASSLYSADMESFRSLGSSLATDVRRGTLALSSYGALSPMATNPMRSGRRNRNSETKKQGSTPSPVQRRTLQRCGRRIDEEEEMYTEEHLSELGSNFPMDGETEREWYCSEYLVDDEFDEDLVDDDKFDEDLVDDKFDEDLVVDDGFNEDLVDEEFEEDLVDDEFNEDLVDDGFDEDLVDDEFDQGSLDDYDGGRRRKEEGEASEGAEGEGEGVRDNGNQRFKRPEGQAEVRLETGEEGEHARIMMGRGGIGMLKEEEEEEDGGQEVDMDNQNGEHGKPETTCPSRRRKGVAEGHSEHVRVSEDMKGNQRVVQSEFERMSIADAFNGLSQAHASLGDMEKLTDSENNEEVAKSRALSCLPRTSAKVISHPKGHRQAVSETQSECSMGSIRQSGGVAGVTGLGRLSTRQKKKSPKLGLQRRGEVTEGDADSGRFTDGGNRCGHKRGGMFSKDSSIRGLVASGVEGGGDGEAWHLLRKEAVYGEGCQDPGPTGGNEALRGFRSYHDGMTISKSESLVKVGGCTLSHSSTCKTSEVSTNYGDNFDDRATLYTSTGTDEDSRDDQTLPEWARAMVLFTGEGETAKAQLFGCGSGIKIAATALSSTPSSASDLENHNDELDVVSDEADFHHGSKSDAWYPRGKGQTVYHHDHDRVHTPEESDNSLMKQGWYACPKPRKSNAHSVLATEEEEEDALLGESDSMELGTRMGKLGFPRGGRVDYKSEGSSYSAWEQPVYSSKSNTTYRGKKPKVYPSDEEADLHHGRTGYHPYRGTYDRG